MALFSTCILAQELPNGALKCSPKCVPVSQLQLVLVSGLCHSEVRPVGQPVLCVTLDAYRFFWNYVPSEWDLLSRRCRSQADGGVQGRPGCRAPTGPTPRSPLASVSVSVRPVATTAARQPEEQHGTLGCLMLACHY